MSILDDNYGSEIEEFEFNVQFRICDALRKVLKNKKSGSHFSTGVLPFQVENAFIQKLLDNDLKNNCLEVKDVISISLHGSERGPLQNQMFRASRKILCDRSRIFFCEPWLLNIALDANYWHVVPRVAKGINMVGHHAAELLSGEYGSIVFIYNWRNEELIIEGQCRLDLTFHSTDDLDHILPYRESNNDIGGDDIGRFFEHDYLLCKVLQCVDAYVPLDWIYDNGYYVTGRTVKHNIYAIKMTDHLDS